MIKRWQLGLLAVGLALLFGSGCKKTSSTTSDGHLSQYIPRENQGVLTIKRMGEVPRSVELLLQQFEGKKGDFRKYIEGFRYRIGINPLQDRVFSTHGLDPKGAVIACSTKLNGHRIVIMAAALKDGAKFGQWLKRYLRTKYVANQFKSIKVIGRSVVTAYRKNSKKLLRELLSYSIHGKQALLAWGASQEPAAQATQHGAAVLKQILRQQLKDSLQTDKGYHTALNGLGKQSQIVLYIPKQSKGGAVTAANKAQAAALKRRLSALKRKYSFLGSLPMAQLGMLLKKNPLKGTATGLSFSAHGVRLESLWPVPKVVLAPLRSSLPSSGSPDHLLQGLHKQAILAVKVGVEPSLIPMFLQQAAASRKIKPEVWLAQLKKYTGLDLKKDIIPATTGRVLFSLDKIDLKNYAALIRGNMFALFRMIGFSVVVEAKDPKLLRATLSKLAKTLQIGGKKVVQVKEKGGRIRYMIRAWPGTVAHWTAFGKFFIYGLGESSLQRAINAIQDPKQRMFADPSKAGALHQKGSSALYLNLDNLRGTLRGLPGLTRLAATMFISSYNLDRLRSLTLSMRPTATQISLQAALQLQPSDKGAQ